MQKTNKVREDDGSNILETAKSRFELAVEADRDVRKLALEDLKFGSGEQWDPADRTQREQERRPCVTINRLPQFNRQIINDIRQNRPAIKVSPVDDLADIETAKVLQGLVRNIEQTSNAELAYDTAVEHAVDGGYGYFRLRTAYADPMSFDQDILIEPIKNRFSVYLDPAHRLPDGSDANWGFIFEEMPKDEFKRTYPEADLSSMDDWANENEDQSEWITKDTVRVAEYFYKEFREVTLLKLSDGSTVIAEDVVGPFPLGITVVSKRKSQVPSIKWCKINGVQILEQTDWPGRWIPIIPVLGAEKDIEGKRILEGVIRHAKGSQQMYNYLKSYEAETIALAPKAPWIGAEGQFEGHENQWKHANTRPIAYLSYKPTMLNGQLAPPPQRNIQEPPIQAISQATMMASEDMKATTGIYDAALGQRSNENSGIAIQRRASQAQTSNFHFVDNLSRAIRHCGRQVIDLIPKIYDTQRALRILGEDGEAEIIFLNKMFERNGKEVEFNLSVGKYDVSVATGPSYATKRQEAASSMLELSKASPQVMGVAGDLVVKNMDWPGAQEISERLKKALPPGVADDPKKQPLPPEAQAQMAQMNQMIEQLTEQLKHKTHQIETKSIEIESRERIAMQEQQVKLQIELAKIDAKDALEMFKAEISQIEGRMNQLRQNVPIVPGGQIGGVMNPSMSEDPSAQMVPQNQELTGEPSPGEYMGQ